MVLRNPDRYPKHTGRGFRFQVQVFVFAGALSRYHSPECCISGLLISPQDWRETVKPK
jgi:hypothetical protein